MKEFTLEKCHLNAVIVRKDSRERAIWKSMTWIAPVELSLEMGLFHQVSHHTSHCQDAHWKQRTKSEESSSWTISFRSLHTFRVSLQKFCAKVKLPPRISRYLATRQSSGPTWFLGTSRYWSSCIHTRSCLLARKDLCRSRSLDLRCHICRLPRELRKSQGYWFGQELRSALGRCTSWWRSLCERQQFLSLRFLKMLALQLDLNDSTFSSLCYLSLLSLLFYSLSCPDLTLSWNQGAKQRPHVCIDYLWLESDRSLALFDYLALLTSD